MGKIPNGWAVRKLGSEIELVYGKALKESNRLPGKVLVCGSGGVVGFHNEKLASGPGVIIGRKGNAGSVYWVDSDFYAIDTSFYVKTKLNLFFSYYLLKSQNFVLGDSAVPGLSREQAYRNLILVPPLSLSERFGEQVQDLRVLIGKLNTENSALGKLRDLLIPQLVTGKLKIKS